MGNSGSSSAGRGATGHHTAATVDAENKPAPESDEKEKLRANPPPLPAQHPPQRRQRPPGKVEVVIYYPKSLMSLPSANFTETGFDSLLYVLQEVRFCA